MSYRFPFTPFPSGWHVIARSDELVFNGVVPLHYFGRDLVLFRSASGAATLLDAYCPHLGAHLGYGGAVVGERIRCPFHGWCYDRTGMCIEIPYAAKIPAKARIRAFPVAETNDVIMAYHHPTGVEPPHDAPVITEFASSEWTPPQMRRFRTRTHTQEIAENIIDVTHSAYVHGMGEQLRVERFEPSKDVLRFALKGPGTAMEGELYGLGLQIYRFHTDLGNGPAQFIHVMMPTPVDEEYVDWRWQLSVKRLPDTERTKAVEDTVARFVVQGVQSDSVIWEHKRYVTAPVLAEGDGPIIPLRRWAAQFYT
jgi:phenylpropionate dioxygenase-like ring-hydroxylating dioxygenase large terminal subunit